MDGVLGEAVGVRGDGGGSAAHPWGRGQLQLQPSQGYRA